MGTDNDFHVWKDPETANCIDEDKALALGIAADEVAHWCRALRDAWDQDQQKQKWRDHVNWCSDELKLALNKMREELL